MNLDKRTANLYQHVKRLCQILEANGFKERHRYIKDGEYAYTEKSWVVYEDDPATTFLGSLCHKDNRGGFLFLKKTGALDFEICWKCGESPITKEYLFSSGQDISFFVCRSCYKGGLSFQNKVFDFVNSGSTKYDQIIESQEKTKSLTNEEGTKRRNIRRLSIFDKLEKRKSLSDLDIHSIIFAVECDIERLRKIGFRGSIDSKETEKAYSLNLEKIAETALKIQERRGVKPRTYEITLFYKLYNECFNLELDKLKLDLPLFAFSNMCLHGASTSRIFKQADSTLKRKYFEKIYIVCNEAYPIQSQFSKEDSLNIMDKFCSFLIEKYL